MNQRSAWLALLALVAGTSAWLDLTSLHDFQNADSLLPVLISTQRWTPFYWGQDRFGMLVPLVASAAHNPVTNLLLQGWLSILSALLAPFIVARALTDDVWSCLGIGALTNVCFLAVAPPAVRFDWLITQPYGLSIALGFGGLVVLRSVGGLRGSLIALLLLLLAHWVNLGVLALVAPLAVRERLRLERAAKPASEGEWGWGPTSSDKSWRGRVRGLVLVAIAAGGGIVFARLAPPPHTTTALSAGSEWMTGWLLLVRNSTSVVAHWNAVFAIGFLATSGVVWLVASGRAREPLMVAGVAFSVAIANWLVVGASEWVRLNLYYPRYMFPSLMMAGLASAALIVAAARITIRGEAVSGAAIAVFAVVAVTLHGRPSLSGIERGLDARFGQMSADIASSGATVVAGDYWTVWPAVFHANLSTYRAGARRRIFGLTYRSEPTEALWRRPGTRALVAGSPNDGTVRRMADRHDLHLTLVDHKPSIDLFEGVVN